MSSTVVKPAASVASVLGRKLIAVSGKGGVGKTTVSQAVALALSRLGRKTLWVAFEDPLKPPGELRRISNSLWYLNCEASTAFEEYAAMKIGITSLSRIFLQNKLVRYLSKAAPGIHELVLLGKIWFERLHYDHVVLDMPSTGYGLAMFQSTRNFTRLFMGGPIHRDAEAMLETFSDPSQSGFLITALPEEMPLQESLELRGFLAELFPDNASAFLLNRRFPYPAKSITSGVDSPDKWSDPIPSGALDYVKKRIVLEDYNLRLWRKEKLSFGEIGFIPPGTNQEITEAISHELVKKGYL